MNLIKSILRAAARIYDIVKTTPTDYMGVMSKSLGNDIYIKREDLQPIFSFKLRGAYNHLCELSEADRVRGVVTCSAGNHAQGVAMGAKKLGISAKIIMPITTPDLKINAVKRLGGLVDIHGNTFDEAQAYALKIAYKDGAAIVHPFDDFSVMAGQGTIAVELASQVQGELDYVFVPVGGGGLIAGVAIYLKYLWPSVRIIAVEEEKSACLHAAFVHGEPVELNNINIFADGIAVSRVGDKSFSVIKNEGGAPLVDDCVQVNVDEICAAIKDIYTDIRAISEPAGAVAVAGIKKYIRQNNIRDKKIATILTGSNINFDRLNYVTERSSIGERKEMIVAVLIEERAGSFLRFCTLLGKRNITEFNYRYHDSKSAVIYVGIKLSHEINEDIINILKNGGYTAYDLTNDEIAKVHVRHMVGGHAAVRTCERLYRFQFQEFPGALLNFLERIGSRFNISMFHYRNNSSAWGSVLAGIEVIESRREEFECYLAECDFSYSDETDSLLNRLFFAP